MEYPFKSFAIAFFICFLVIFFLGKNFLKTSDIIPVSLEIEMSGDVKESHDIIDAAGKNNSQKKQHDLINQNNKNQSTLAAVPIYQPLPAIPDELRSEAFNSFAIARFYINQEGSVDNVELIKPCANPKLNQLLLKSLKKWKFSSKNKSSHQDIKVTFEVK